MGEPRLSELKIFKPYTPIDNMSLRQEKERQKLYDAYPETESYKALVAKRRGIEGDEDAKESCDDANGQDSSPLLRALQQTAAKRDINKYSFVLNDELPLICTALGHALADAEPVEVLRTIVSAGADLQNVQLLTTRSPNAATTDSTDNTNTLSADQMVAALKKQHSEARAQYVLEATGNTLDKAYYKAAARFFKEHRKATAAFQEGMKIDAKVDAKA